MKYIYAMLVVILLWCSSAESEPVTATVPTNAPVLIELHDQFDHPQKLSFPTTNVTFLTIADRNGSEQLAGWIAPVKQRFGERIDIRGIADVSTVPGLLRSLVRKKFRELQTYPVMMDWTGDAVKAFTYARNQANVLVLDERGRILLRSNGPVTDHQLEVLCAAIDAALAAHK